jgi:predicted alpha/beta-hydrolase family hydrolase
MIPEARWTVPVGDESTSAVFESATGNEIEGAVFVCAHGAGGNMNDRGMLSLANVLRKNGLGVVRFNFLYKEKKSGRPDPMPKLEHTFEAVVEKVREELKPTTLIIGGRSMGGRAATMMAAKKFECDGLLLYAYPLHPAGQPTKLRDAHLPDIEVPVLCFNGTRDALCTPELMENALKTVKTDWTMHWIEGADHSFHVLKSSCRNDSQVLQEIGEESRNWIVSTLTPQH